MHLAHIRIRTAIVSAALAAVVAASVVAAPLRAHAAEVPPQGMMQVGAFEQKANAEQLKSKLEREGYGAAVRIKNVRGKVFHAVYRSESKAVPAKPVVKPAPAPTPAPTPAPVPKPAVATAVPAAPATPAATAEEPVRVDILNLNNKHPELKATTAYRTENENMAARLGIKPVEGLGDKRSLYIKPTASVYRDGDLGSHIYGTYNSFGGGFLLGTTGGWYVVKLPDARLGYIFNTDATLYDLPEQGAPRPGIGKKKTDEVAEARPAEPSSEDAAWISTVKEPAREESAKKQTRDPFCGSFLFSVFCSER